MKNKILSNLSYVFCAGLGLFNFIFLAIPYVASFYSYDYGSYGKGSNSEGISGYKVMDLWDGGFGGVMSGIVQILLLILGICMLAYGVMGLLKAFGIFDKMPEKVGKLPTKKYGEFALYAYAGLNVLLLIFLIILCATNSESESEFGYEMSAGIRLSAGIFITLIFGIGSVVAQKLLEKKFPVMDEDMPKVEYICSKCGKKVKKGIKFCPDCGGKIVEVEILPALDDNDVEQPTETADVVEQPVDAQ